MGSKVSRTRAYCSACDPEAPQVHVRWRQTEILEEDLGHLVIVVLSRVHQHLLLTVAPCRPIWHISGAIFI
jgi:hypothetical protein